MDFGNSPAILRAVSDIAGVTGGRPLRESVDGARRGEGGQEGKRCGCTSELHDGVVDGEECSEYWMLYEAGELPFMFLSMEKLR